MYNIHQVHLNPNNSSTLNLLSLFNLQLHIHINQPSAEYSKAFQHKASLVSSPLSPWTHG